MRVRGSLGRALLAGLLLAAPVQASLAAGSGIAPAPVASPSAPAPAPAPASASSASTASLSVWRGGIDLYRPGVFTTQKTWYYCTAASVQIARNIVMRQTDHSASAQRAYFDWMRLRDRYPLPLSAGVDAAGWTAGFQHFIDGRYRLFASPSFDAALRAAVTNLRKTNRPVALAVDHGNHAWLLTGFTATADPARTSRFTVTSVRIVGPLYGLQSRNGYDMPPDTRLTPTQLRRYFTPWYYPPIRMVWDGKYISIQAVAAVPASTAPKPSASPVSTPSPSPSPTSAAVPSLEPVPSAMSAFGASPSTWPTSAAVAVVASQSGASQRGASPESDVPSGAALPGAVAPEPIPVALVVLAAALVAVAGILAVRRRPRVP